MSSIGRVDFKVDFDGKTLPAQARAIGERMGKQLSRSMQSEFDKEMGAFADRVGARMNVTGKKAGREFSQSLKATLRRRRAEISNTLASMLGDRSVFEAFVKNSENVDAGLERITQSLHKAREAGIVNEKQFKSMTMTFRNWGGVLRENERQARAVTSRVDVMGKSFRDVRHQIRGANRESGSFFSRWKTLPRGFRRFTAIGLLVAAIAEGVAVLGSAVGSSLTVALASLAHLASAAGASLVTTLGVVAAGAVGVAVLATAFVGLTKEIDKLPARVQPAARQVKTFYDSFKSLRGLIQERIFADMGDQLEPLNTKLFPVLREGVLGVADAMRGALGDAIGRLTSEGGLGTLKGILDGIAATLVHLIPGVTNVVSALGGIWLAATPFIVDFAGRFEKLTGRFDEWVHSVEGQSAISDWFARGRKTMDGFVDGVLNLGGAIKNIFEEGEPYVSRFQAHVSEVLAGFKEWTDSLEGRNALAKWFSNGERIMKRVEKLAVAVGKMLDDVVDEAAIRRMESFLDSLAGAMTFVGELIKTFGAFDTLGRVAQILDEVGNALKPVFDLLQIVGSFLTTSFSGTISLLATVLNLALIPLRLLAIPLQIFGALIEAVYQHMKPFLDGINENVNAHTEEFSAAITEVVNPAIDELIKGIFGFLPTGEQFVALIRTQIIPWIRNELVPAFKLWLESVVKIVEWIAQKMIPWIVSDFLPALDRIVGGVGRVMDYFAGWLGLIRDVARALGLIKVPTGLGTGGTGGDPRRFATGGLVTRPTRALIGESGPEVVVPLRRPLGNIDPSVRALSAILQGKAASGGDSAGPRFVVESGAIRVEGTRDSGQAANAILDRLVARMGT